MLLGVEDCFIIVCYELSERVGFTYCYCIVLHMYNVSAVDAVSCICTVCCIADWFGESSVTGDERTLEVTRERTGAAAPSVGEGSGETENKE